MDKTKKKYLTVLIGAACLTVIVLCYQWGMLGNDYWWHIKVGEWVFNNHAVPHTDIFSWYASPKGVPFTAHEWLADVFLYLISDIFGSLGMFVFSVAFAVALIGVMLWYNRRRIPTNNIVGGSVLFILFSVLCKLTIYGRPQIFNFAFLWYELFVLYRFIKDENSRLIYTLPVLSVLWANMHGGSSNLSYILCIIVLLCGLFGFDTYKLSAKKMSRRQIKILAAVTVISAAALCINPYGVHMLMYPYRNVQDTFMWEIISEWAAPDAKSMSQVVIYYIPVFIILASMVFSKKKIRLTDGIITLFFLFLFFRSQRFIVLLIIAASLYIFDYPLSDDKKPYKAMTKSEKAASLGMCTILAVAVLCTVPTYVQTYKDGKLIDVALSQDFIGLIKEEKPQKIFNDYNFGETLIYNDIPVFFDSRADVYSGEIIRDGVSLLLLTNNGSGEYYTDPEAIIEKYGFDAFVIDAGRPLYIYLKSHPELYTEVKCNGAAAYFSCSA